MKSEATGVEEVRNVTSRIKDAKHQHNSLIRGTEIDLRTSHRHSCSISWGVRATPRAREPSPEPQRESTPALAHHGVLNYLNPSLGPLIIRLRPSFGLGRAMRPVASKIQCQVTLLLCRRLHRSEHLPF